MTQASRLACLQCIYACYPLTNQTSWMMALFQPFKVDHVRKEIPPEILELCFIDVGYNNGILKA